MAKRIFSFCLCFLLLVPCLAVPAKADSILDFVGTGITDIFDWFFQAGTTTGKFIGSLFKESVCIYAPGADTRHNFIERHTEVDGVTGYYYVCEYCGKSAGEVGQEAYDDYTTSLPATGYNSAGNLVWQPSAADVLDSKIDYYVLPYNQTSQSTNRCTTIIDFNSSGNGFDFFITYAYSASLSAKSFSVDFVPPVSGYYCMLSSQRSSGQVLYSNSTRQNYAYYYDAGNFTYRTAGNVFNQKLGVCLSSSELKDFLSYTINVWFPYYEVIPDTGYGDTYNTTTRPTTITGGNYGIVGDDGQLTIVTVNDSIINEYNNTYYNPATGNTETITNWFYDYSDRSYNVTLESGDTVTVTYGDQNITIIEGGDTYIIYYVINNGCTGDDDDPTNSGSPSGPDDPSGGDTHEHSWQETGRTEPLCTVPGKIEYICEDCDHTRVDVLPATGHTWQVERTVQTAYDNEGNLIQQGYTIYQCSVCGEQYKDDQGTGPPGSSGDDDGGGSLWDLIGDFFGTIFGGIGDLLGTILFGIIGLLEAVLSKLLDALVVLGEMIMGKLADVVGVVLSLFDVIPMLFGGFLDFLSSIFSFLPDEIMLLLTFGIAALVFVGIIKAIWR